MKNIIEPDGSISYQTADWKKYSQNDIIKIPKWYAMLPNWDLIEISEIEEFLYKDQKMISVISINPSGWNAPLTISLNWIRSHNPRDNSPIKNEKFVWFVTDESGQENHIWQWPIQSYTLNKDGLYLIKLKVYWDDANNKYIVWESTQTIIVNPQLTTIWVNINWITAKSINRINIDNIKNWIIFDPSLTTAQKWTKIVEYIWDFWNWSKDSFWEAQKVIQYYDKAWTYTVNLNVKDNLWATTEKNFKLIIEPLTAIVDISPKSWFTDQSFKIHWEKSRSSDTFIKSFNWTISDSLWKKVLESQDTNFVFIPNNPDTYWITLSIENNKWEKLTVHESLQVYSKDPIALFNANPKSTYKPWVFLFDWWSSYDIENEQLTYSWDFNWDWIYEIIDSPSFKEEYAFEKIWVYTSILKVTDTFWNQNMFRKNIEVVSVLNVDFDISRIAAQKWSNIVFTPEVSNQASVHWNFWDWSTETISWDKIEHSYDKSWIFEVRMTAIDVNQNSNAISKKIYIGDWQYPVWSFFMKINWEWASLERDICWESKDWILVSRLDSLEFDAKNSVNIDNSNQNLAYTWDFWDWTYTETRVARHRYKVPRDQCYPVNVKVKDLWSNKLSKMSNTIWVRVVNKKPIIGQIVVEPDISTLKDWEYYTPTRVKISLPLAKDDDSGIKKYRWWYHKPYTEEKLWLNETYTPRTSFLINPKGPKWALNEYLFTVEVEDNEGLFATNEEIFWFSEILRIINWETQSFSISFTASNNQVRSWEYVTFFPSSQWLNEEITYQWDFDGDWIIDEKTRKKEVSYKYTKKWIYDAELRIESQQQIVERAFKTIYVDEKIIDPNVWANPVNNLSINPWKKDDQEQRIIEEKLEPWVNFSSIELWWEWVAITAINIKASTIKEDQYKITAQVIQADSTKYEWIVEFVIKNWKWEILNPNIKAVSSIAVTQVNILAWDIIEIEVRAKDTVYWDLVETIYIKK